MPHLSTGNPGELLLNYIAQSTDMRVVESATAVSTGALATSEDGAQWLSVNGISLHRTKSDVIVTIHGPSDVSRVHGISVKHCNNRTPTNAQVFFTTATAFCAMLEGAGIEVSENACLALRQFCGDVGFRPIDDERAMLNRDIDSRRYFWEEVNDQGRRHWQHILSEHQDDTTRLLLQEAYPDDPFVPQFLLHKTKKADSWASTEVAIYAFDELIQLSRDYSGFCTKSYSVNKGSFRDPKGIKHHAPRFGIVQMQRGGQQQHPNQLQFNLQAGYFYKI